MKETTQNGKNHPVIVAGFSSQDLTQEIAAELGSKVVTVTRKQFEDKEIQTTIEENVRGHDVVVIASASGDPNKQEKEARLLMRAANRAGARKVTLVLPYMWYGRSDDIWDERNSPALTDTIETLRAHCQSVVVADPHNAGLTREKFLDTSSPVKNCTIAHFAFPFAVQLKSLIDTGLISKDISKGERLRLYLKDNSINPATTLIIGDSEEECEIARDLSLVSVAITGGTVSQQRLRAANPDYIIHDFHELLPILQRRRFL